MDDAEYLDKMEGEAQKLLCKCDAKAHARVSICAARWRNTARVDRHRVAANAAGPEAGAERFGMSVHRMSMSRCWWPACMRRGRRGQRWMTVDLYQWTHGKVATFVDTPGEEFRELVQWITFRFNVCKVVKGPWQAPR